LSTALLCPRECSARTCYRLRDCSSSSSSSSSSSDGGGGTADSQREATTKYSDTAEGDALLCVDEAFSAPTDNIERRSAQRRPPTSTDHTCVTWWDSHRAAAAVPLVVY